MGRPGGTVDGVESVEAARLKSTRELEARVGLGLLGVLLLLVVVGGWSMSAQISGAVVASGTLVVDSSVKSVEHAQGGIVASIPVRDGDIVRAGEVVLRLDDVQLRSGLGIINSQLLQLTGRGARLEGMVASRDELVFPTGFEASSKEARIIAEGERRLFRSLRLSKKGRVAQLGERIAQLQQQILGLETQRKAKGRELELIEEEQARVQGMHERKLIPVTRLLAIKRDVTRVAGEYGALRTRIASVGGQVNEARLQILTLEDDARSKALEELRSTESRISELMERQIAAQDQLARVEITAPQDGIVHDLRVHTVGGVVEAAQQIMLIVPQDDDLRIEARISRHDIDRVRARQIVKLRFPSFNQRLTPEVDGIVLRVSADLETDTRSGTRYYVARIALSDGAGQKLVGLRLLPGMPVEAFIQTTPRTVLSYLMKPVSDNLNRAFRED